jgi:hypothetical protein
MTQAQFRTDNRLWAAVAVCVFVALGFVDPFAGAAKGENNLWARVAILVTGDYICSTTEIILPILIVGAFEALSAAALGWVAQAAVVMVRSQFRSVKLGSGVGPPEESLQ